jgi:hypothetical protein
MPERPAELQRLADVATSMEYPVNMRMEAIDSIGKMGSHEALLVLLEIAGNEGMLRQERERALKHAAKIVKSSH